MTTRIFLLRHAESANPNVFHGAESDTDLSARGVRQADLIAYELTAHEPQVVISSAMRRAHRTAESIARVCRTPHLVEPLLHERRVGILSGQSFDYEGIWAETARRWTAGETSYAHDGAESFDEIHDRVMPIWRRIVTEQKGERVVVVAHGVVCKTILVTLFPTHTWQTIGTIHNAAITELSLTNEKWELHRLSWQPPAFADLT
jgi:probable phosphoglycerate mutase